MSFRGWIRLNANPETGEKEERTMDTIRKIDLYMHSTVAMQGRLIQCRYAQLTHAFVRGDENIS
jgi:hypothetical protein